MTRNLAIAQGTKTATGISAVLEEASVKSVETREVEERFHELLAEVVAGETIEITDQGVPVARFVPVKDEDAFDFTDAAAAIREWEQYRDEHHVRLGGGITIRELIEEGRR